MFHGFGSWLHKLPEPGRLVKFLDVPLFALYRADIFGAGENDEKVYSYRLGGQTCLAGDVIGDYSFDQALTIGQRLVFDDMAHYTMVKTTTFNGINLPAIAIWNSETDQLRIVREFGYDDFKQRLS